MTYSFKISVITLNTSLNKGFILIFYCCIILVSARHSSFYLGDHWLVNGYDFVFAHSRIPSCICYTRKMNQTLFDCGFKQKVELRSEDLYDITATLPKAVKLKYDSLRCGICRQSFFGKQYLDQNT